MAHEGALCFFRADVPVFLRGGEGDGELFFELGEVLVIRFFDVRGCAVDGVVGVFVPGVEEEFEVDWGEVAADVVHSVQDLLVVEAEFAAFVGGFLNDGAALANGVEGAGDDFAGAHGVVHGDVAKLGDVEELEGAAAAGGGGHDARAVFEPEFAFFWFGLFEVAVCFWFCKVLFEKGADVCEVAVEVGGVGWEVVEVGVCKGDFGDFFLGVGEGFVHDCCRPVFAEEHGVEDEDCDEGGDAELADFEDGVTCVHVVVELTLSPIHSEAYHFSVFVEDPIEVVEARGAVG